MSRKPSIRAAVAFLTCLCALASGCEGTRGATPLPEPPALDGTRIQVPDIMPVSAGTVTLQGSSRSATPGSTLRVTNLDSEDEPSTVLVATDGSFALEIEAEPGDELRFEAEKNGERSDAVDLTLEDELVPSPRHDCIRLEPEFRLEFVEPGREPVFVQNTCGEDASISAPRLRLAELAELAEFAVSGEFPLSLSAGDDASFEVAFEGGVSVEDVLFVDIEVGGVVHRYPLTLWAP